MTKCTQCSGERFAEVANCYGGHKVLVCLRCMLSFGVCPMCEGLYQSNYEYHLMTEHPGVDIRIDEVFYEATGIRKWLTS